MENVNIKPLQTVVESESKLQSSNMILFNAIRERNIDKMSQILRQENDNLLKVANPKGQLPLTYALSIFGFYQAAFLLENGADPNAEDLSGWTPLDMTLSERHFDEKFFDEKYNESDHFKRHRRRKHWFLKFLITKGANVNFRSRKNRGFPPIHDAIESEDVEALKILLQNGAKFVRPQNVYLGDHSLEIYQTLIDFGAEFRFNGTQMNHAIKAQNEERIRFFLENGIDVNNECLFSRKAPIHMAIERRDLKTIKLLIDRGAKTNVLFKFGDSNVANVNVLSYACAFGNLEIIKFLLENGEDMNAFSRKSCYTPIHCAIMSKKTEIVKYLISNGASLSSRTKPSVRHPEKKNDATEIALVQRDLDIFKMIANSQND